MTLRVAPTRTHLAAVVFCFLGIACAVFAVVAQSRAQTPRRVVSFNVVTAPAPVVVADDCPVDETCMLTGARAAFVTAVMAAFSGLPTNDLTHAALAGTRFVPHETLHRETVQVRTSDGVVATVVSRCADHGSGVRASQSPTVPKTGPATVFVVVPGRPGCSVAVVLQVPAGVVVPWSAATTLAHRPALQLPA